MVKKNLEDERNKIGCLIENPALYMDMTARQNLEIQRTQRGIPGKSSIDEVLEIMDLKDAGNKRVKAFSLGMKQRLGIAIALLGRPQLLILDEPINGLDPTKIKYVREVLKNMNEEDGTTILISSHILPELHQLATVYGFIHHGKMLQQITDKELDEKCRRHVHIEVDNVEKASCILDERYPESQIKVYLRNVIKVFGYNKNISDITKELVYGGVGVEKIGYEGEDLEEYYTNLLSEVNRMRQLKAEYYKMKYSRASKWVLVFMAFIFFIPFVVGNEYIVYDFW